MRDGPGRRQNRQIEGRVEQSRAEQQHHTISLGKNTMNVECVSYVCVRVASTPSHTIMHECSGDVASAVVVECESGSESESESE